MGNWDRKTELTNRAIIHTNEMQQRFSKEIEESIRNTVTFNNNCYLQTDDTNIPVVNVINSTTEEAIFIDQSKKTVLNFASYKNPGGAFMKGSSAQEEMLCHSSTLYNVLREMTQYYEHNKKILNKGLYTNQALYSPDIIFVNSKCNMIQAVDVLTCAAPNFLVGKRYGNFSKDENTEALVSRIKFIKNILESSPNDTLILGAYGCGVFKQDPYEVASIFKEVFKTSNFKRIIHPIPGGKNLEAFKKVFGQ